MSEEQREERNLNIYMFTRINRQRNEERMNKTRIIIINKQSEHQNIHTNKSSEDNRWGMN